MRALDPEVLQLLACPCPAHAPLTLLGADGLRCTSCGRTYPIRDGIPVLLLDEAVAGTPVPEQNE